MHSLHKPPHELSSSENEGPGVLDWIRSKRIDLVINIPEGTTKTDEVTAGYLMRRAAVDFGASLLTNIKYGLLNTKFTLSYNEYLKVLQIIYHPPLYM